MRLFIGVMCALIAVSAASAQSNLQDAGYRQLEVVSSDEMEFSFATGQIQYITAANLVLIADDESENLPIRANRVTMDYADEDSTVPTRILLEGNVEIEHPEGKISSARVDMDFGSSIAQFTGDPVMYNARFPDGFFADEFLLDLDSQEVRVKRGRAKRVELSAADPSDKLKLTAADVSDWEAFLTQLKNEISSDASSPGKHIGSLLDAGVRSAVTNNDVSTLLEQQGSILRLLNSLIKRPELYNADAWAGRDVSADVTAKLNLPLDRRTDASTLYVNRGLLHAAYPDTVAAPPAPED